MMLLMWKQGRDSILTVAFPTQDPPPWHPAQGTGDVSACHTWPCEDKCGGKPTRESPRMLLVVFSLLATKFIRNLGHITIFSLATCAATQFLQSTPVYKFLCFKPQGRISWQKTVPKLQKQRQNKYFERLLCQLWHLHISFLHKRKAIELQHLQQGWCLGNVQKCPLGSDHWSHSPEQSWERCASSLCSLIHHLLVLRKCPDRPLQMTQDWPFKYSLFSLAEVFAWL